MQRMDVQESMTDTEETYIASAYDLLDSTERRAVDEYVAFVVEHQRSKHQRVLAALNLPIPNEYLRRSRDALYRPLLRAAITERIKEESAKYDISPDKVINEYAAVAFSDITDFFQQGMYGEPTLKDLRDIPADKAGAIKSIECQPGRMGLKYKITLHDKLPALKTLSDWMGMTVPERPPVLEEYVREELRDAQRKELVAPETEYTELLEAVSKTKEGSAQ